MPNMKKEHLNYLLKIISYLYIFIGYSYIILFVSYNIRIQCKPEGWAFMLFKALFGFIAYTAINHILIRRIVKSHKLLIIIEASLFIAMLTLVISDMIYNAYIRGDMPMPIYLSWYLYPY
jgi:hypothetical protein